MCGHIGAVIRANIGFVHSDSKIVDELLYMDALRGDDSTGLAIFSNDGEMHILKDAVAALWLQYTTDYQKALELIVKKGKAVIGHNRKKTIGKADEQSAHPFVINDEDGIPRYAFAHNGTLTNHTSLTNNLKENLEEIGVYDFTPPKTEVDSEVLGTMLCLANGDKEKLETVLGKVWGAYACVWIDQVQEKLYMIRNIERPLFVAKTTAGWFWASEQAFLYAACNRNRLKIDECFQIDTETLYAIDLNGVGAEMTKEKLSPKKALAPTKVPTKTGTKESTGANCFRFMGKKAFLKFAKRMQGTIMGFYMDDYVQRCVVDNGESGWHVWGRNEDDQLCRGSLPPMDEVEVMYGWASSYIEGIVDTIEYDEKRGQPILHLKDLKVNAYETCH